ncbi:MAG: energy-coupling factor transporter transmembrane protein EcfT [Actinomycetota bacterium]|nr:energy-coupling factor transporter transmembrane protein EcfT [Actinomycetota bacterium]
MLELQRNVIFGQFVDTGSPVHRLDVRIKLVATALLVVASFLVDGFLGFALLFPLLMVLQLVSRVPFGYVARGSSFFLFFLGIILVFQVFFYPGEAPQSSVLWQWGFLSISTEGLRFAAILGLRVLLLYHTTTMLMLTTSLVDLTNGLELLFGPLQKLRVPVNELVLVGVISVKFVPIFISEVERLSRAYTARGVPFDEGGPITRARRLGRLLVPVFVGGFRRADLLTTAMDVRCYRGGRGRTKLRRMEAGLTDWLVLLMVVVWVLAAWKLPGLLIA